MTFASPFQSPFVKPFPSEGAVAAFVPTSISSLRVWLDFSDLTTLFTDSAGTIAVASDGDVIGKALDKSEQGNHFTQSTTAQKPIWKANLLNGKGVMYQVDVDDKLAGPSLTYADATVYAVMKSTDTSSHYWLGLGDSTHALIQGFTSGKHEYYSTPRTVIGNISTSAYQNINTIVASTNGVIYTNHYSDIGGGMTYYLAELYIFNEELSAGNQASMNAYILSKWGV